MEQFAIKRPVRWIPMGAVLSVGLVLLLFMYHGTCICALSRLGHIADCSFAGSITTSIPFATHNRYDNSRPQIPLRLLPLGDSTTKGGMFDGENSYRPALRNLLIGSGRYLFCASRRVWLPDSLTLAPQVAQSITLAT